MESLSPNLESTQFVTFRCNQTLKLGYNDLFLDRKILVVGLSNIYGNLSYHHMLDYNQEYEKIKQLGIDEIYLVSSDDLTVGPWADKHSKNILGLADPNRQFVKVIADWSGQTVNISTLSQYWQYVAIINSGSIEKVFYNHIKEKLPLRILKDTKYRYHGLAPHAIIEYLKTQKS